jgi:hypothetical protein
MRLNYACCDVEEARALWDVHRVGHELNRNKEKRKSTASHVETKTTILTGGARALAVDALDEAARHSDRINAANAHKRT